MRTRPTIAAVAALVGLTAAAPAVATTAVTPSAHVSVTRAAAQTPTEGPHSPVGRRRAATTTVRRNGVVIREVDLGDAAIGPASHRSAFRTPVRGILVTRDVPSAHAPLIVVSHLRMPGCSNDAETYPCPRGSHEVRYDRGMTYYGEAMAKQGYAVLIPDLAPMWSAGLLDEPYDQLTAWLTTVGPLRDTLMAANAGRITAFGAGLKGAIDGSRTALVVHSRSAYIAPVATRAWARSSTPIRSILAYGGAYSTPDEKGRFTEPAPAGVPFLGVVGELDQDVDMAGSVWAAQQVEAPRTAPAFEVVVPGFGHTYINRTLSAAHRDDRIDPPAQPDAARHEQLLIHTSSGWFGQTVRHLPGHLPLTAGAALPATLDGVPARWLAATNAPHAAFVAGQGRIAAFGGGQVRTCRYYQAMDPTQYKDRCPDPDSGTAVSMSVVSQVHLTPTGGARITLTAPDATGLALQVAPTADRTDHAVGTPLRVTVRMTNGRSAVLDVPATHPALRDRRTADVNGSYVTSTIRLALPASVAHGTVSSVELTGGTGSGSLDVRAVDVLRPTAPTPVTPAPSPKPAPTPSPAPAPAPASLTSGSTVIVDTAPGAAGAALAARQVAAQGGRVTAAWPEIGVTVGLFPTAKVGAVVTRLKAVPGVQQVGRSGLVAPEPARVARHPPVHPTRKGEPGDIAAGAKGPQAKVWATGKGVTIGIADTGVYDESPELAGRFDARKSGSCANGGAFTQAPGSWRPSRFGGWYDHGTESASAAAGAHDGIAMQGVAPEARIAAIRVVSEDGDIYPEAGICAAMTGAREHLPIVNHSYGLDWSGALRHSLWDPANPEQAASITAVERAFAWSRAHGVLDIAATGNDGEDLSDKPHIDLPASEQRGGPLPARLRALLAEVPGVMGVGEVTPAGPIASSSTSGFGVVDLTTVGSGILATAPGSYDQDAGTSFAAPAVAGAAALVKQIRPQATPDQIEGILESTATPRTCTKADWIYSDQPCRSKGSLTTFFGHGQLDARAAVLAALKTR